MRRPAKSQPKPNAYVGPDAEGPFRGVCTAAVGFCCRTAPLPPLPPPPPVAPLIPVKVSSKFYGVSWDKSHNQWQAVIKVAGKKENLGFFDDEAEAARAFDKRAAELGRQTNFT